MAFSGWPVEALEFYEGLRADNSRVYFTAHRQRYEQAVREPMLALLAALEPEFGPGKLFRPHRDVRFSADKSPYKTHQGAMIGTAGYVQLSADGLAAGAGMYQLASDQLARYRRAVADDVAGAALERAIRTLRGKRIEVVGHSSLKSAPRGYPAEHPRAELLRHKGLTAWRAWPPAAWLGTAAARTRIVDFLRGSRPLTDWLTDHVGPSELDTGRR